MASAHTLKREYYDALRQLTLELSGIQLGRDHTFQIETRLAGLAREEGYGSLAEMIEELFASGHNRLAVRVVSTLLERDARFFSDLSGLGVFARHVLPRLAAKITVDDQGQRVLPRVLVFGCASGQDVWTLAILARQYADRHGIAQPMVTFVGADYPSTSLERAKAGVYTHFEVQRGLPTSQLVKYFTPAQAGEDERSGGDWQVEPRLREGVSYTDIHLLDRLDPLGMFDCVVFRASLARYSGPARVRVMRGVAGRLPEGAPLLLNSNEVLEEGWLLHAVPGAQGLYEKETPVPIAVTMPKRTRFGG